MRIAICDDEVSYREQIQELLSKYISKNNIENFTFSIYSHAEELLEDIYKDGDFDIFLLDIVMPGMNGIDLGKELRKNGYDGQIIYLTSSVEYAIDSYMVRAFNYILKPIDAGAFFSTLDSAFQSVSEKKGKYILVRTPESSVKIRLDNILYAQLIGRNISYFLTDGSSIESIYIRTRFANAVQELLNDKRFLPCGAGMVANMHHITKVDNDSLQFMGKYSVSLGIKICRAVRAAWVDFCLNEEM